MWTADSSSHEFHSPSKPRSPQSREPDRKEKDETKELKNWVGTLKKQCEMYEEIISMMDEKITTLSNTCKELST
jgi:hypothetical protein